MLNIGLFLFTVEEEQFPPYHSVIRGTHLCIDFSQLISDNYFNHGINDFYSSTGIKVRIASQAFFYLLYSRHPKHRQAFSVSPPC